MFIPSYELNLTQYDEYVAHKQIRLFIPPVLLAIGSLGNMFAFCILIRNVEKASTYIYLSMLAVMDLLVLYTGLLRIWIGELLIDIGIINNILCKLVVFLGYVSSDTSVWLIVAVTVERTIVVMVPFKAHSVCNTRNARICIFGLVIVFVAVNSHFLWTVELQHFRFNETVISLCKSTHFSTELVENIWPWVDAGIYSFVPFLIIIVLNSIIIRSVFVAKRERNLLRNKASAFAKRCRIRQQGEMSKKITVMLLTVSFTFLVTTLPMNLVLIYTSFAKEMANDDDATFAKRKLIKTVAEVLMYTNHSINFFLYCATGKKFRSQFRALICCNRKRMNQIGRPSQAKFGLVSVTNTCHTMCADNVHPRIREGTHV